jgi:hypothetical protein
MGTRQAQPCSHPATDGAQVRAYDCTHTGEIPLDLVRAAFSEALKWAESENKENVIAA